ncbi:MAG: CDP-alcohol phosphatidyltransferase family protein [Eubacterium sp.]|nr:CDP-alcohol phosphatidyltransferase family protein [Eubacterium sp.]
MNTNGTDNKEKKPEEGIFYNWNTIPNWLCFLRIALIPVFSVLFIKDYYIPAFIVMIVAALTDLFDGKIARRFNMVSNLGKMLDPIADKLSQMAIVIILIYKYWGTFLKYILIMFIVKELLMLGGGVLLLAKGLRPSAADIWGKVSTTVFYVFMIAIIALSKETGALKDVAFFRDNHLLLSNGVMTVMVVIALIMTFAAMFSYVPGFIKQIKEKKKFLDQD